MLKQRVAGDLRYEREKRAKGEHRMRAVVLRLLFVAAIGLYLLFVVEQHIRPIISRVIAYESEEYATLAFNAAVAAHLQENPELYDSLFTVTYDETGAVTSLTSNTYAMNVIKSELTEAVMQTLALTQYETYPVRLGKLLGIQMLAGRGPYIDLYIKPDSYVTAEIYDTFEEAGNNQTKLNVYANFTVTINVMMAGYTQVLTVENDVLLTQNLFLGKVADVNL